VRRLVVTDKKGKVSGLITQTDVTRAMSGILLEKLTEIRSVYFRTQHLFKDSVKALFQALDAKDHYTGNHSREVAKISFAFCNYMKLSDKIRRDVYLAGLFHDIGKIHVVDSVLNKQGPLDKEEFELIKKHPIISETILKPITEFKEILGIIRHHHEWYNGDGYPDGIKGEDIPIGARIITLVDSYNAMRTDRPYRAGMSKEAAVANIKKATGKQFDPKLAPVFIKFVSESHTL